jgi:hypothetical protein
MTTSKQSKQSSQQPKLTNLQRFMQVDNCNYQSKNDPDYITRNFCCNALGITSSKCLMTSGLKDCQQHWNQEWDGGVLIKEE